MHYTRALYCVITVLVYHLEQRMDRDGRYLKKRIGTNYIVASHDSGCDTMHLQFTIKSAPNT